ncbi:MAG TPA: hypothetical protein PK328_03555 [Chitinophagaceae bacterium]|nr:hypothetical protein [Chitinophagaceae bacterium]
MDAFTGLTNTTNVLVPTASDNYKERITYDANGNIQTYLRNGEKASNSQLMNNLRYQYEWDASGNKINNKHRYVLNLVQGNSYSGDLKTQSALTETQFNNAKSVSLTGDN